MKNKKALLINLIFAAALLICAGAMLAARSANNAANRAAQSAADQSGASAGTMGGGMGGRQNGMTPPSGTTRP